jgi:DNA modification methylase
MPPTRRPTSTSNFGAGRRESHDATAFYERFTAPTVSSDEQVNACSAAGRIIVGDSRDMSAVESSSVALVVTSPPYFAGKAYEEALGEGHIPASYLDYLTMLRDVFSECVRVLEPGGRIAVNVANLGRRPYRSLTGDITTILQDDLGLLLRGEVVWVKADGASGSTAWGSFQSAANPVLRDLSERIVVASKGRFDRAPTRAKREKAGLPFENTISKPEFMDSTLDIWRIQPESARRVGHPAPFPVEVPRRCIELLTYRDDVVLDPFMGSGSTAVAAVRADRRYVGYDTDPAYVALAEKRVAEAQELVDASPTEAQAEAEASEGDREDDPS